MSTGSTQALVLPSAKQSPDEPIPPGERAHGLLLPFLDPANYTAVAIVHGLSQTSSKAFDLVKQRLANRLGVVWLPDRDLRKAIKGGEAAKMKNALAPFDGKVITFFSVLTSRTKESWALTRFTMTFANIDTSFAKAGLGQ